MNKLKLDQKVILNEKAHSWHTKHINDCYLVPSQKEYKKDYYEDIACLLGSKAKRSKLRGIVKGFGCGDDEFKGKRNFVLVEFKWKGLKVDFYCSENDLRTK